MTAALAAFLHSGAARLVEEQHRLRRERAALGGAERQHIDAGLPGRLAPATHQTRQRIGEARAVDVHRQPALCAIADSAAISSTR